MCSHSRNTLKNTNIGGDERMEVPDRVKKKERKKEPVVTPKKKAR